MIIQIASVPFTTRNPKARRAIFSAEVEEFDVFAPLSW